MDADGNLSVHHLTPNAKAMLRAYKYLTSVRGIDPANVTFSGHSLGSWDVIHIALSGRAPGANFVAFGVPGDALAQVAVHTSWFDFNSTKLTLVISEADFVTTQTKLTMMSVSEAISKIDLEVKLLGLVNKGLTVKVVDTSVFKAIGGANTHDAFVYCQLAPETCFSDQGWWR
jgi:hypothetical protein